MEEEEKYRRAFKLIALRSRSCRNEALKSINAPAEMLPVRYRAILPLALRDPEAEWTDEEREMLLDLLAPPPMGEERTKQVNIRLSPTEYEVLRARAEAEGMTVSAWARKRLLSE